MVISILFRFHDFVGHADGGICASIDLADARAGKGFPGGAGWGPRWVCVGEGVRPIAICVCIYIYIHMYTYISTLHHR